MSTAPRRAIVLGAGIGGLACALALVQRSWDVTVLERSGQLGEVGAGISIWPRAMTVLTEFGVHDSIDGEYVMSVQSGLRQPSGRVLVAVRGSGTSGPVMVHRARLHAALAGHLDAQVLTGVGGVAVHQNSGGASVVTADGRVFEGDVVIGADGLRSMTRSALHGESQQVRYAGYTAYRGVASTAALTGGETWGRGARFGYAPLHDGRTYWYATANRPRSQPDRDHVTDARVLVHGWHDPIPSLVESTPPDGVLRDDVFDLELPLRPFHDGHVALLGDAAHAMTPNLGQGACAAIEDAAALAAALDGHPRVPDALAAYDAERRPPTQRLIRRSRQIGKIGQVEQRMLWRGRDAMLWLVGRAARLMRF